MRAIDRCEAYHICDLGPSSPVSLNELDGLLEEALGKRAIIGHDPPQPDGVPPDLRGCDVGPPRPGLRAEDGLANGITFVYRMDAGGIGD